MTVYRIKDENDHILQKQLALELNLALQYQEKLFACASEIRAFIKALEALAATLERGTAYIGMNKGLRTQYASIRDELNLIQRSSFTGNTENDTIKRIEEGITGEKIIEDYMKMMKMMKRTEKEKEKNDH